MSTSDSSDEDDVYLDSATRYKALKAKNRKNYREIDDIPLDDSIEIDSPKGSKDPKKNNGKNKKRSSVKPASPPAPVKDTIVVDGILPKPKSTQSLIDPIVIIDDNRSAPRSKRRAANRSGGPVTRSRSKRSLEAELPIQSDLPTVVLDPDDSLAFINQSTVSQGSIEINDDSDNEVLNDFQNDGSSIDVKVRWRSKAVERIQLGKDENFTKIFKYFAKIAGVSESQILITRNEVMIMPTDTPSSINLTILDVLEGGIINESMLDNKANEKVVEPVCKIKIQTGAKKGLSFDLKPNEPFQKLLEYCAEQNNVSVSKVKCFFDGDLIAPTDTPESLDLEDEGCVDLKIIS